MITTSRDERVFKELGKAGVSTSELCTSEGKNGKL
jgi:hypothetical protein